MNNLLFDFTVNKATKTVFVTREFEADQSLVWDAFTKKEILDQWWAPKPYRNKIKSLEPLKPLKSLLVLTIFHNRVAQLGVLKEM